MCGFTGVIAKKQKHPETSTFMDRAMADLHRRGPDQQKIWESEDQKIALGFARLAIRDLSENGQQPMLSTDGRWVIMYNGETYNTDELKHWAQIDEKSLKGTSDTEIILKAIQHKGVFDTISRLDGIFAIAIIDLENSKLYLSRDLLGVKPLYLGLSDDGMVFSSNYHQLLWHPYCKENKINPVALAGYFKYGFVQVGEGLFENTFFIPQGNIIEINTDSLKLEFHSYEYRGKTDFGNLEKAIEIAVNSQLVSDVPIGTFLSGGIDSSIVSAYANKANNNITSFTIGVDDPKLDESLQSMKIAKLLAIKQELYTINEKDILSAINQYDDSLAEPLADYSSLLTLKVCEFAKRKLTVVLSGDGGDELFWGYPRMKTFWLYYPFLKKNKLVRFVKILLQRLKGKNIPFRLLKFKNKHDYYLSAQGLTGNRDWQNIILAKRTSRGATYIENHLNNSYKNNLESWVKNTELHIHLQRVLLKVDRASMYHSLEVRTPLLSPVIRIKSNEYSFSDCIRNGSGKQPLRKILNKILNDETITNDAKKGFEPPLADWMRMELKDHIEKRINDIPTYLSNYLNKNGIASLWNEHQQGKNNTWPLWAVYSLLVWLDKTNKNEKPNN